MTVSTKSKAGHWLVPGDVARLQSGPRLNRTKPHYHFVVATTDQELLVVPVSSTGAFWESTIVIPPPQLTWLSKRSFVSLRNARLRLRASVDEELACSKRASQMSSIWPVNVAQSEVLSKILFELPRSILVSDFPKQFLDRASKEKM